MVTKWYPSTFKTRCRYVYLIMKCHKGVYLNTVRVASRKYLKTKKYYENS